MRYLMILAVFSLAACGGGSSGDDNSSAGSSLVFSDMVERFRGTSAEPELTDVTFTNDFQRVNLNSLVTGGLLDGENSIVSFQSDHSQEVAIVLAGSAEDMDLEIYNENLDFYILSQSTISHEALIFRANAYVTYYIDVSAYRGSGDFYLKVVEANRESLGLEPNEYFVAPIKNEDTSEGECVSESGFLYQETIGLPADFQYIFNPVTGAVRAYSSLMDHTVSALGTRWSYVFFLEDDTIDPSTSGYVSYRYNNSQGFRGIEYFSQSRFDDGLGENITCSFVTPFSADLVL